MVFAATVSPQAFDISFWRQLHDNIQLGTSVVYNDRLRSAVGSIFYQWMFNDTTVRGMVDSEWSVGFNYNRCVHLLKYITLSTVSDLLLSLCFFA